MISSLKSNRPPELWRACRFIQILNNNMSRFGDSHGFIANETVANAKTANKATASGEPNYETLDSRLSLHEVAFFTEAATQLF